MSGNSITKKMIHLGSADTERMSSFRAKKMFIIIFTSILFLFPLLQFFHRQHQLLAPYAALYLYVHSDGFKLEHDWRLCGLYISGS